mgnify:CR=1 FL=1
MDCKIVRLTDKPELKEQASGWFHEKWGIPPEAYRESMDELMFYLNAPCFFSILLPINYNRTFYTACHL